MTRASCRESCATSASGPIRSPDHPPLGASGPHAYESCLDVDPTPDYANVLTD